MKPLPMPIRLAAGLVVTALEEVQELPRKLTELPVTAVSQALQASMRVQQRVTELAIKGDRALGALRPVPETPAWVRFDEDEELGPPEAGNGFTGGLPGYDLGPDEYDPPRRPTVTPVRILPDPEPDGDYQPPVPLPRAEPPRAGSDTEPSRTGPDTESSRAGPDTQPSRAGSHAEPSRTGPDTESSRAGSHAEPSRTGPDTEDDRPAGADAGRPEASGPPGLAGYERWSLPQLRGRFRSLSRAQLESLLSWETAHRDRPPYVTMLSNRIASLAGR